MANKERVQLLVDALKSGEFNQITGYLETTEGNCCLGVAGRVSVRNGLELHVTVEDGVTFFDDDETTMPQAVMDWYGFVEYDPMLVIEDGTEESAIDLNDSGDYDFNKIADAFKRTYIDGE